MPLLFVDLSPDKESREMIWQVKEIESLSVKFEKPKAINSVIQCKNCLKLSHSRNFCFLPARCAICAELHQTGECQIPDVPTCILPTCALCKETHVATYKGCKVYKEVSKKRFPHPKKAAHNQSNKSSSNNRTYAKVTCDKANK